MWQVFAGTVLLAGVLAVVGLWALLWAVRKLEDDDAEPTDVRADRPRGSVAEDWQRRDHQGDMCAVLTDLSRKQSARRATTPARPRGPARLSGRDVPPAA